MERIVFLERNTIQAEFPRPNFEHEWIEYKETGVPQVGERVRHATIIISNKLSLGEPQLSNAPQVRLIAIAATGSDCVDLEYCRARGIAVCNVRGYAVNTVPEHVLMLMLALRRNLLAYRTDVQRGLWNESKQFCLLTHELYDIRNDIGEATITMTRPMGLPGVAGAGSIAVLNFTALTNGQGTMTIPELKVLNSQGLAIPATTGELPVTVQ
jgi:hypothetical protein